MHPLWDMHQLNDCFGVWEHAHPEKFYFKRLGKAIIICYPFFPGIPMRKGSEAEKNLLWASFPTESNLKFLDVWHVTLEFESCCDEACCKCVMLDTICMSYCCTQAECVGLSITVGKNCHQRKEFLNSWLLQVYVQLWKLNKICKS